MAPFVFYPGELANPVLPYPTPLCMRNAYLVDFVVLVSRLIEDHLSCPHPVQYVGKLVPEVA